jgi:hypothetical protein
VKGRTRCERNTKKYRDWGVGELRDLYREGHAKASIPRPHGQKKKAKKKEKKAEKSITSPALASGLDCRLTPASATGRRGQVGLEV